MLKGILSKKDKSSIEYYWAVIIEPSWVQVGIWRIETNQAQIVFMGNPVAWELEDDLVNSADSALSAAIQNFPEDLEEPTKTVFSVISSWVKEGQIKNEHLSRIKTICEELSLKPVGFVVLSEAISHFLKAKEGSPVNAIVAGVYKNDIEISIFQLGNLIGNTKVSRSVSVVDDFCEGLSRFAENVKLPSRFIIYDGREAELEEVRQTLFKVDWDDYPNLKFLHPPKIEIIESKSKLEAVTLAGASEIAQVDSLKNMEKEKESLPSQEEPLPEKSVTAQDLGFSYDQQPSDLDTPQIEDKTGQGVGVDDQEGVITKDFGEEVENVRTVDQTQLPVSETKKRKLPKISAPSFILKIFTPFKNIFVKSSNFIKRFLTFGKAPFILGIATLVVAVIVGLVYWWFFVTAEVTIYVSGREMTETFDIEVGQNGQLQADVVSQEFEGEKTTPTSGTKVVGDKATGEVTLYRAGSQLTLDSGTQLKSPQGLVFVLNESVTLASASASTPSTVKARITADDIGDQYNLSSQTSFQVSNYSTGDVEAKNEDSFSGGSSREVKVASQEDMDDLFDDLRGELLQQARKDLESQAGEDDIVIEDSLTIEEQSKDYNLDVGEEADNLSLNLSILVEGLMINRQQLDDIVMDRFKDKLPEGFILEKQNLQVDLGKVEENDGQYIFEADARAKLLPSVDVDELRNFLLGKYPEVGEKYLQKTVPGFVNAEVNLNPQLPGRLGTLPRVSKNLEIIIAAGK